MNARWPALLGLALAALVLTARADEPGLSTTRLDLLDEHGYFTPRFKQAVHKLVATRQALRTAQADEKKAAAELPGLRQQAAASDAQTNELRAELAGYAHPENNDYQALQAAMKNVNAQPESCVLMAQAFVWSYPADPRAKDAQADLQQGNRLIDSRKVEIKAAMADRGAAHAGLLQRVKARDLSFTEWRAFLQDMTPAEVLQQLGSPSRQSATAWVYPGSWITDPATGRKAGLQVLFNGTRVLQVVPANP